MDDFIIGVITGVLSAMIVILLTAACLSASGEPSLFDLHTYQIGDGVVVIGDDDYYAREYTTDSGMRCAVLLEPSGSAVKVVGWTCDWDREMME